MDKPHVTLDEYYDLITQPSMQGRIFEWIEGELIEKMPCYVHHHGNVITIVKEICL